MFLDHDYQYKVFLDGIKLMDSIERRLSTLEDAAVDPQGVQSLKDMIEKLQNNVDALEKKVVGDSCPPSRMKSSWRILARPDLLIFAFQGCHLIDLVIPVSDEGGRYNRTMLYNGCCRKCAHPFLSKGHEGRLGYHGVCYIAARVRF